MTVWSSTVTIGMFRRSRASISPAVDGLGEPGVVHRDLVLGRRVRRRPAIASIAGVPNARTATSGRFARRDRRTLGRQQAGLAEFERGAGVRRTVLTSSRG
jgi:hypothetical protein